VGQQFQGKNSREVKITYFTGILNAFGQESRIFRVHCSAGEFLLSFVKVISNVIICLAPFIDFQAYLDATYDATLAERQDSASVKQEKYPLLW
jgi:hypothetical protein